MYSINLTTSEKNLGFKILQMPNPNSLYIGEPTTVDAVVYELNQANRVVKIEWPDGRIEYSHLRLTTVDEKHRSSKEWKPVCSQVSDPVSAITLARNSEITG